MNVLALVLAGHLVGDWLVQTDWQARTKVAPSPMDWSLFAESPEPGGSWMPLVGGKFDVVVVRDRHPWRTSWRAMLAHMVGYHASMAACVAPAWHDRWALVALAVSWVTHSFIDRRRPVLWLMRRTGSAAFAETSWGPMAVDQALHLSILCLLVGWAT